MSYIFSFPFCKIKKDMLFQLFSTLHFYMNILFVCLFVCVRVQIDERKNDRRERGPRLIYKLHTRCTHTLYFIG